MYRIVILLRGFDPSATHFTFTFLSAFPRLSGRRRHCRVRSIIHRLLLTMGRSPGQGIAPAVGRVRGRGRDYRRCRPRRDRGGANAGERGSFRRRTGSDTIGWSQSRRSGEAAGSAPGSGTVVGCGLCRAGWDTSVVGLVPQHGPASLVGSRVVQAIGVACHRRGSGRLPCQAAGTRRGRHRSWRGGFGNGSGSGSEWARAWRRRACRRVLRSPPRRSGYRTQCR